MDINLNLVDVAFCLMFLAWVLLDFLKQRRESNDKQHALVETQRRCCTLSTKITLLSNFIISLFYLGFCILELLKFRTISFGSLLSLVTWSLATVVTVYSMNKTEREQNRWPLVLLLWWVFSCIFTSLLVFLFILVRFTKIQVPKFSPEANIVDIASIPFSLLLCFNILPSPFAKKQNDIEHPLLRKEVQIQSECVDAFSIARIWSHLTFMWLNPLFQKGQSKKLELVDIPSIPQSEKACEAFSSLEESLKKQRSEDCSLTNAIIHIIWKPLLKNAVLAGVNTLSSYLGPLLITNLVNFLTSKHESSSWKYGVILSCIFFLAKTVESLSQRQWYFGAQRIGIRLRAALMVLVYKKSLSLKHGGISNGSVINFINVDVERIGECCLTIHGIWLLPIQVILALIILYRNLGVAPSLGAFLATVFVMVSNTPLVNMQKRLHTKIMEARDSRIKATSETLKSMRVLKLNSWESTFMKKVLQLRESERSLLKKYLYTCSSVAFLFWSSPTLVSVVTFGICIILKTPLTSGAVLSVLATFRILQEPIYNLPELISMIAQTKVSLDRIQEFINREDQKKVMHYNTCKEFGTAVEIQVGEYAWEIDDAKSSEPTIKITKEIKITKGFKVAICGSVGSGKSSLLCSIFGGIPRISGADVKVYGSKAYVPQHAWIQTGTIRDNVLFGKEMNKSFYNDVVEGCALSRDIEMWVDKDFSIVGERGLNLSGGQKQRVQLARAIYSDSDIYLLDDPFSAVDAHTGAHMFKRCLKQLLERKTVIYATHQLEFLEGSDLVLVMKDGRIVQSGKYQDLIADCNGELYKQMAAHNKSLNQVSPTENYIKKGNREHKQIGVIEEKIGDFTSKGELLKRAREEEEEETETGRVKWNVYSSFVTSAYRGALVPIVLLCHILFQGLQIASNYWLAWASEGTSMVSKAKLIGIFALLSGGSSLFVLGRAVLLSTIVIETGQRLFLDMLTSVVRAPLSFFDSTPSSRILSRSSTDQSIVDTDIPYRVAGLAFALIQLLSIMALMSRVAWQVSFLFIIIIAISIWYQAYYIKTARELARMIGIRKAPILHHFSESITGKATIRCFNQEERFLKKNINLVDDYSRVAFHNTATMEWLSVRINFLFNLVFFLLLVILVNLPRSTINPSLAGLAATYGLNLNVLQGWVIWNLCNVENKMISVERILQFTKIPSEAPLTIENCKLESNWPTDGRIELENLHFQYGPSLPTVLKGITCTFPGEKKIGVVGRTGSGKSTLIQALFRVVEPSQGRILIDGVDISKIDLHDLRSRLSIIPQDPTLFQGTMRTNLDPLQQHSDSEIWEVLKKCRLEEIVKQDQRALDAPVAEDGENWSMGQRQLVCLARVLLQKRRILVLDEATASVDTATDNVIQRTIRGETSSRCTVITVAHRIPTVVDNDLVLVLEEGKVIEYDSPVRLLKDHTSAFSKLVAEFLLRSSKRSHKEIVYSLI